MAKLVKNKITNFLSKERMNDRKVYHELGKALSAIDNALDELEKEKEIPYTNYAEQLERLYQDLEEIRKDIDDGKYGGEQGRGPIEDEGPIFHYRKEG